MIASDPVETKRVSLGSILECHVPALTGCFMAVRHVPFIMTLDSCFTDFRVQVPKAVGRSVTCKGSVLPMTLGNGISAVRICLFWPWPGGLEEETQGAGEFTYLFDSQQDLVQKLPCGCHRAKSLLKRGVLAHLGKTVPPGLAHLGVWWSGSRTECSENNQLDISKRRLKMNVSVAKRTRNNM